MSLGVHSAQSSRQQHRMNEKVLVHFPGGDTLALSDSTFCHETSLQGEVLYADETCPLGSQFKVLLLSQSGENRVGQHALMTSLTILLWSWAAPWDMPPL